MDNDRLQGDGAHDSKYRNTHPYNYVSNAEEIGKSFVSYKHQNTIDSFWFAIKADIIFNPFDYVTVEQKSNVDYVIDDKQSLASTNHNNSRVLLTILCMRIQERT